MSLGSKEEPNDSVASSGLLSFVKSNPNIIFEGHIGGGVLHALTSAQVREVSELLKDHSVNVEKGLWFLNYNLRDILQLRGWYLRDNENLYASEKDHVSSEIVKMLYDATYTEGQIRHYSEVLYLMSLRSCVPDIELYSVQFTFR